MNTVGQAFAAPGGARFLLGVVVAFSQIPRAEVALALDTPLIGDGPAPTLDEGVLSAEPFLQATDLESLLGAIPARSLASLFIERSARTLPLARAELLSLASLHRVDALAVDVRIRVAQMLAGTSDERLRDTLLELLDRPLPASVESTAPSDVHLARALAYRSLGAPESFDASLLNALGLSDRPPDGFCAALEGEAREPRRALSVVAEVLCDGDLEDPPTDFVEEWADARLRLGRDFFSHGADARAREVFGGVLEVSDLSLPVRCDAALGLGRAEERTGSDAAATDAYAFVIASCPDEAHEVRARYGLGRIAVRGGRVTEALESLDPLIERYPASTYVDDALSLLADVYRGQDAMAEGEIIERLLALPTDGDLWREAVWRRVRPDLESGDPSEAMALLARSVQAHGFDSTYYSQGRFETFLGVLSLRQGEVEEASTWFQTAIDRYPLTFYAAKACSRLEETGVDCAWPHREGPAEPVTWPLGCLTAEGRWRYLAELGLLVESAAEIRANSETCDEALWIAALLLDHAGAVAESHDIPRREISGWSSAVGDDRDRLWEIAYPMPYSTEVDRASSETGVPAALIWAIMREESAFDPSAHSYAGARGLMQLMPRTAADYAADFEGYDEDALYEPATSITMGARYLARSIEQFGDNTEAVIASYNAGRGAARSWIDEGGTADWALWVEDIGPTQTRNYTKRVYGSWLVYRYLLGE